MAWWTDFPVMDTDRLTQLKKAIDGGFLSFTRTYGDAIEKRVQSSQSLSDLGRTHGHRHTLAVTIAVFCTLAWIASRSWRIVVGTIIAFVLIGYLGMWEDTMKTVAMILVSTLLSVVIGVPVGIAMSRWSALRSVVIPVLDVMQTMPSFVYLIPVVMILGIGKVPGLIAVVIYALPPMIRLTDLGIRLVDAEVLEAADAFGSSPWQKLVNVQLPLALPTIMAGINQTIMMALAMVVVASMIGVQGLGQPVLKAIANQYFTSACSTALPSSALPSSSTA